MQKVWGILLSIFICFTTSYSGFCEEITIEKELLEKILKRQDLLEKKVYELQKKLDDDAKVSETMETQAEKVEYIEEDIEEMSGRLDKVETKTILDKIQISGDIQTRVENFNYDDMLVNSLTGQKDDRNSDGIGSNRIHLNLRSDITKDLIFHSRLTYFKLWGGTDFNGNARDWNYPSIPDSDGDLHVERAYIDYFVPNSPFAVTFGRLPSTDGPPGGFRNYKTRKSTWPKLMLDAESDGVIGTVVLDKWTGLHNNIFRVGYAKLRQNYLKFKGSAIDETEGIAVGIETELPWFKDSFIWLGYVCLEDLSALTELPESAAPLTVESYHDSQSSGSIDLFNLHIQIPDIKESGFSWFGSVSYMNIDPNPNGTVVGNIPVMTPQGVVYVQNELGFYGDSLHGTLGKNRDAHAFYTGITYRLPFETLKNPLIGFEYNYGSKYWTGQLNSGGGDIINKFDVNGHVYDLYYIQPIIDKHMFCKIGAAYMDYEYYNAFALYGDQSESDMRLINFYFLADVRF